MLGIVTAIKASLVCYDSEALANMLLKNSLEETQLAQWHFGISILNIRECCDEYSFSALS